MPTSSSSFSHRIWHILPQIFSISTLVLQQPLLLLFLCIFHVLAVFLQFLQILLVLAAEEGRKLEYLAVVWQYQGEDHHEHCHWQLGLQDMRVIVHVLVVDVEYTAVD